MSVISFFKTNCQNCYACVRTCPVEAIRIHKGQAEIMDTRCVACGMCLKVCPKNAKKIQSELDKVKGFLRSNERIAVSLAPSFVGAFGEHATKLGHVLKQMGFSYIEETVIGAKIITNAYDSYALNNLQEVYITSCCPSVNYLIQKHYPDLISNLFPIVSPLESHARLLKEKYGNEVKVVFIGPCLSKKLEGIEEPSVDAVLTFDELYSWLKTERIELKHFEPITFEATENHFRNYPLVGGVTNHLKTHLQMVQVEGLSECIEMLGAIRKGQFKDVIIEMSACRYSCVGGPAMPNDGVSVFERIQRVKQFAENNRFIHEDSYEIDTPFDLTKTFKSLFKPLKQPTDEEIKLIMNHMGKYTILDELNCGFCGYNTCRDKAIAIFNGNAETIMCLPFMKQKAETLSNVIFDVTPSIILLVDPSLNIIEFNPAAENFFDIKKYKALGMPVSIVLDSLEFEQVMNTKQNIIGKRNYVNNQNSYVIQSIVWIEYHEVMLCIVHNITEEVKKDEWMKNLKINAFHMAQEVINKQMRVAQEIASLLGETTAETKVTLTRLKELIKEDEVD